MVICCYYYSYNTNSHNIAQASCKLTVLPKFSSAEIMGLNNTEGSVGIVLLLNFHCKGCLDLVQVHSLQTNKNYCSQVWGCTPLIPALRRERQGGTSVSLRFWSTKSVPTSGTQTEAQREI